MNTMQIIAIVIFAATIITVMTEKVHRAVAAVVGALLLILRRSHGGVRLLLCGHQYHRRSHRYDAFRSDRQELRHL